jgi:transcription elongation factor Elf1
MDKVVKVLNLKTEYDFDCCYCGHKQKAHPSIMMVGFQMNSGGGSCLKCRKYLRLQIDENNERMISFDIKSEAKLTSFPDNFFIKMPWPEFQALKKKKMPN